MADTDYLAASDGTGDAALMHVTSPRVALATIIQVDTVVGVPAFFIGTWGTLLASGFIDPTTKRDFFGHVNAGTLVIDKMAPGNTDGGNTTGQVVVIKPSTPTQNLQATFIKTALNLFGQGQLLNGKIITSVNTNNINVAIKTLAGVDPSASDPVYVRIGNNIRSITAALSVTKNAGTNWFNSGAAETAAQEIDYFVYLGFNATDGVTLGFARIPYATTYNDFSVTSTNPAYAAISTITNAAATDVYENVGRFNATLSATASFNWSIPATSVIINRPIQSTRKLIFAPQWNVASGTQPVLGNGTFTGIYHIEGRKLKAKLEFQAGSTTTFGTNTYQYSLPFASAETTANDGLVGTWVGNSPGGVWLGWVTYISSVLVGVIFHSTTVAGQAAGRQNNTAPTTWAATTAGWHINVDYFI